MHHIPAQQSFLLTKRIILATLAIVTILLVTFYIYYSLNTKRIYVWYDWPYTDYSIPPTCSDLKTWLEDGKKNNLIKVQMPLDTMNCIINSIQCTKRKITKFDFAYPVVIVQIDTLNIYQDDFGRARTYDGHKVEIPRKSVYLLLKYSLYFNNIFQEDIKNDQYTKEFGIPKNYKFTPNESAVEISVQNFGFN